MNRKVAIGILFTLIFVVCVGIGNNIYKINNLSNTKIEPIKVVSDEKVTDECTQETEELALANAIEKKISPNAIFVYKIEYLKCGHTIKKYESAPNAAVNKNETDLKEMYSGWEIESFSNNEVVLKSKVNGICDEHYVIRDEEGQIVVYTISEDNKEKVLERTGIITQYLPEIDRQNVQKGIFVNGHEALNALLEDFE